jgi:hypothetical protein
MNRTSCRIAVLTVATPAGSVWQSRVPSLRVADMFHPTELRDGL